jgi:threonine dehydratase
MMECYERESTMPITFSDIEAAARRIADGIYQSPCAPSEALSEITGCQIYCKLDHMQRTGSFKERGDRNALLLLDGEQRNCGVVAASAGNHALGLAYHGKQLGIPVTVVMPHTAPLMKVANCKRLAARVILHGENIEQARVQAMELVEKQGLTYINGYDDPAVIVIRR